MVKRFYNRIKRVKIIINDEKAVFRSLVIPTSLVTVVENNLAINKAYN